MEWSTRAATAALVVASLVPAQTTDSTATPVDTAAMPSQALIADTVANAPGSAVSPLVEAAANPRTDLVNTTVSRGDSLRIFPLGDVVVTGARRTGSNRVRPTDDNRAQPARDVAHAVGELPGVVLSQVGPRNESQMWLRGFDSRQTGLYLDGVPIYVPYDGNVDLARFSTSELSSISVEKGASSLALGPNSMGGAVNLVSRRPAKPLEISTELAQLGRNGQQGSLTLGTRLGPWYALASGSFRRSGGTEVPEDFMATRYEDGFVRNNGRSFDRTFHAKAGWTGENGGEVALSVTDQHGTKGVPPYAGRDTASSRGRFWKWPYWDKRSVYELSRLPLTENVWIELPVYFDAFRNSLHAYDDATYGSQKKKSSFRSGYDDWTAGGSARLGWARRGDTAKVFAHFKSDNHHETNTTNDTAKAATTQVFLGKPDLEFEDRTHGAGIEGAVALPWNLTFAPGAAWNFRSAERADNLLNPSGYDYSVVSFPLASADMWDAQGTLRWTPNTAHQIRASVSSRTHFPTIKDRYSYKLGSAIPNPDLKAERALQIEFGYATRPLPWLSLEASVWEAWITDALVTASKVGPAGEGQTRNAGHVRHGGPEWLGDAGSGFALPAPELAARADCPWKAPGLARLEISGSWSYLLRRDLDNASFRFVDQPRHKFYGSLLWSPVAPVDLVASSTASSSRPGTSTGTFVAGGYLEVDLLARWRIGKASLEAGLQNAFDEVHALSEGYPEPGRTGFVRARFESK